MVSKNKYEKLEKIVRILITEKLDEQKIKYSKIESRIKSKKSLEEKIARKNIKSPEEYLKHIDDFLGVRIVTLFMSDLEVVGNMIKKLFTVHEIEDKIEDDPLKFGYFSIHYVVSIEEEKSKILKDISKMKFEIQVRTITMDSWANISRYLNYKNEESIPTSLQKSFNAISALFYLSDKTFEDIYDSMNASKNSTMKLKKEDLLDSKLNYDTYIAYMMKYYKLRYVGDLEFKPLDSEFEYDLATSFSVIVSDLINAGYNTVRDLNDLLLKYMDQFLEEEEKTHGIGFFTSVGMVRGILNIVGAHVSFL